MEKEGLVIRRRPERIDDLWCAKLRPQSDKGDDASAEVLASGVKTVPRPKAKTVKGRQSMKRGKKDKGTKVVS